MIDLETQHHQNGEGPRQQQRRTRGRRRGQNLRMVPWKGSPILMPFSSRIGEGSGTPLQCSCLENPMDGGAWKAAVHGSQRVGHDWAISLTHSLSTYIGEGNGNPLQCSCLESPRDGGAWWAAISGIAQSRTRLKLLSSSSSSSRIRQWKPLCPSPGALMEEPEREYKFLFSMSFDTMSSMYTL